MQSFDPAPEYIIPPELTGPIPRRPRFDPVTLVFPLLMILFFAGLPAYVTLSQINKEQQLRQSSNEATGEIDRVTRQGRSRTPTVDYTFGVNGTSFTGNAAVPDELFSTIHRGDSLTIRYVPSNPLISHPTAWEWPGPSRVMYVMPLFGLPFAIIYWVTLRSQRRLAFGGVAAIAKVTGCSSSRSGIFVNYDFQTVNGVPYQGKGSSPDRKEPGALICILYMPDNPLRNGTYPFTAYRIPPQR
jgi:hypothetical protein